MAKTKNLKDCYSQIYTWKLYQKHSLVCFLKIRIIKERRWKELETSTIRKKFFPPPLCAMMQQLQGFSTLLPEYAFSRLHTCFVLPAEPALKTMLPPIKPSLLLQRQSLPSPGSHRTFFKTKTAHQQMAIYLPMWPISIQGNYIIHFPVFSAQLQ